MPPGLTQFLRAHSKGCKLCPVAYGYYGKGGRINSGRGSFNAYQMPPEPQGKDYELSIFFIFSMQD